MDSSSLYLNEFKPESVFGFPHLEKLGAVVCFILGIMAAALGVYQLSGVYPLSPGRVVLAGCFIVAVFLFMFAAVSLWLGF